MDAAITTVSECFFIIPLKINHMPVNSHSVIPYSSSLLVASSEAFVPVESPILGIPCQWNHTVYVLCVWVISFSIVFLKTVA